MRNTLVPLDGQLDSFDIEQLIDAQDNLRNKIVVENLMDLEVIQLELAETQFKTDAELERNKLTPMNAAFFTMFL